MKQKIASKHCQLLYFRILLTFFNHAKQLARNNVRSLLRVEGKWNYILRGKTKNTMHRLLDLKKRTEFDNFVQCSLDIDFFLYL